jgi:hypothetical protein
LWLAEAAHGAKNDSGTEKKYAEEFHWFLPMYFIAAMVGRAL